MEIRTDNVDAKKNFVGIADRRIIATTYFLPPERQKRRLRRRQKKASAEPRERRNQRMRQTVLLKRLPCRRRRKKLEAPDEQPQQENQWTAHQWRQWNDQQRVTAASSSHSTFPQPTKGDKSWLFYNQARSFVILGSRCAIIPRKPQTAQPAIRSSPVGRFQESPVLPRFMGRMR